MSIIAYVVFTSPTKTKILHPASFSSTTGTVCTDGTVGIQTDDSCCVAECGECGGVGCSTRVVGLGASDCCSTEIADSGELCSETGAAPCVVDATGERWKIGYKISCYFIRGYTFFVSAVQCRRDELIL